MSTNPELDKQAREIIEWSRRKLVTRLPEFLPAIYLLPLQCGETEQSLWTDGETIFYHPETVVRDYLQRKDSIAAQIMHITAHGLLGHIPKRRGQQPQLFDAVADAQAASLVERLPASLTPTWKRETREHVEALSQLTLEAAYLTPETREEAEELVRKSQPLRMDDHEAWTVVAEQKTASAAGELWKAAARQVAEAMAKSGKRDQYGDVAGMICDEFRNVEESGVSYKEFLRRFCSRQERQEVDPDSINAVWYRVGMDLTGSAPFIEPEELREDAPALDLAVALDTSGSCSGETMKGFLEELMAILRDAGGPKVEMTLIQCDAEIQKVQTIGREDSVEDLMENFEVYGYGGTDFRPVFDYVNQQREEPDGKRFKGLLYLSDGYGDFPEQVPEYPVAFLFPRDEDEWEGGWFEIPEWVTQVRITPDDRLVISENSKKRN